MFKEKHKDLRKLLKRYDYESVIQLTEFQKTTPKKKETPPSIRPQGFENSTSFDVNTP